jgi:hypothetical protein
LSLSDLLSDHFASLHSENICLSAAGFVEVYHSFCFTDGRKPLLTPLLRVGSEVTDAGTHDV